MTKRAKILIAVLCGLGLTLACASPPPNDPNPQPDHGVNNNSRACPRSDLNTICVEFYANTATSLKIRVTGLNGKGEMAPITEQIINVYPGGGSVGFSLPLDNPPVAITGRAQGPKGIIIGCRVVVRGLEIGDAQNEVKSGTAVCLFTTG